MIVVTIYKDQEGFIGFEAEGHAEYAESGTDIICAAVSVLMTNTVNSIEMLTSDKVVYADDDGFLTCRFPCGLSAEGKLLVDSMVLGLRQVEEIQPADDNDEPYVRVLFKEVQTC
jgi:hypothetical protein